MHILTDLVHLALGVPGVFRLSVVCLEKHINTIVRKMDTWAVGAVLVGIDV